MGSLSYLETYSANRTVSTYRKGIRRFLEGNPRGVTQGTKLDQNNLEEVADRYLQALKAVAQSEENPLLARENVAKAAQDDVQQFLVSIKGQAPKSIALQLSTLRTFLAENQVELPRHFWSKLRARTGSGRAITQDHILMSREPLVKSMALGSIFAA